MTITYGCGKCRENFGTLGLFDRHQDVTYYTEGALRHLARISCIRPETLGMLRDANGTWQTPEGLLARSQRATRLAAWRHREEVA